MLLIHISLAGQQAGHQEGGKAVMQPVWNTVWEEVQPGVAHADAQGGGGQAEEEGREGESLNWIQPNICIIQLWHYKQFIAGEFTPFLCNKNTVH